VSAALVVALHGATSNAVEFLESPAPGSPPIDQQLAANGYVVAAPDAVIDVPLALVFKGLSLISGWPAPTATFWQNTTTPDDPTYLPLQAATTVDDSAFLWSIPHCVRDVLNVSLTGDVYMMGHSMGAKMSTFLGCVAPPAGYTVRAVVVADGIKASALDAPCTPPPLLAFQAANDQVVPFCVLYLYAPGTNEWHAWSELNGCIMLPTATDRRPIMNAYCPSAPPRQPPRPPPTRSNTLQPHRSSISHPVLARPRANALNGQAAKPTLFRAPVARRVLQRALHALARDADAIFGAPAEAAREGQDFLAAHRRRAAAGVTRARPRPGVGAGATRRRGLVRRRLARPPD
jgi:hypothetical protein